MTDQTSRPFPASAESLISQLRAGEFVTDSTAAANPSPDGEGGLNRPEPPELSALRRRVQDVEREQARRRQGRESAAVEGRTA